MPVTNTTTFLSKFLLNHGRHRFCLNYFCNFQTNEKLKQHQIGNLKSQSHGLEKTFKTVLNKKTNKLEEKPGNI